MCQLAGKAEIRREDVVFCHLPTAFYGRVIDFDGVNLGGLLGQLVALLKNGPSSQGWGLLA